MLERLGNAMLHVRLGFVPVGLAGLSLLVLILAVILDVAVVKLPSGKQVGYLWAWNWTVSATLLFPLVAAAAVGLLKETDRLMKSLQAQGMIASKRLRRPISSSTSLGDRLKRALGAGLVLWLVLCAAGVAVSAKEWWEVCAQPILEICTEEDGLRSDCGDAATANLESLDAMNRANQGLEVEKDWSVASLFRVGTGPRANIVFDAIVFLVLQSLMIAALAFFVVLTGALVWLVVGLWGIGDLQLVPDLKSFQNREKRGGFHRLERPALLILGGVLSGFLALYLTSLQNIYLRQPDTLLVTDAISQPIFEVARTVTESDSVDWSAFWKSATSIQIGSDYSSTWATFGSLALVVVFWLLVVCATLVVTPILAKRNLRGMLSRFDDKLFHDRFGASKAAARQRLAKMLWWPYEYLPLNLLLGVSFVLFASVLQPGIVLVLVGIGVGVAVFSVVTRLWVRRVSSDAG